MKLSWLVPNRLCLLFVTVYLALYLYYRAKFPGLNLPLCMYPLSALLRTSKTLSSSALFANVADNTGLLWKSLGDAFVSGSDYKLYFRGKVLSILRQHSESEVIAIFELSHFCQSLSCFRSECSFDLGCWRRFHFLRCFELFEFCKAIEQI